jgi:hypothetical protein
MLQLTEIKMKHEIAALCLVLATAVINCEHGATRSALAHSAGAHNEATTDLLVCSLMRFALQSALQPERLQRSQKARWFAC